MTITRWKLTIEYKGTDFCGWQRQDDGVPTVQQAIEDALYAFCQKRITIHAAGRTDSGVHALGQVVHFDLDYGDRPLTGLELTKALNAHLRPQMTAVLNAEDVHADFHARFDATSKLYTYRILNRQAPPTIGHNFFWHVRKPLDLGAMREAAQHLLGKHDFSTFRDSECQAKDPVRTLDRLDLETHDYDGCGGTEIRIHTEARSFLHHQVRNMAGSLVMVGEGKWTPDDLKTALEARDRTRGGPTAPPDGLTLVRVDY